MKGVESVGAGRAGSFLKLMPLFTTALAVSFLNVTLTPLHALGAALIVGGSWFTASGRHGVQAGRGVVRPGWPRRAV